MADAIAVAKKEAEATWSTLRKDLEVLGKDIARLGDKHLSKGQDAIAEEVSKLRATVSDLVGRLSEQGQAQVDGAMNVVRNRPITTLLSVFGVGVVAAILLSRKAN